jgi:hypothetical protein
VTSEVANVTSGVVPLDSPAPGPHNVAVALRPELQAIYDALLAAYPQGLTLDELGEELYRKPVSYADIDEIIGALEEAGFDLDGPPTPAKPEELHQVLSAARALYAETGNRPTTAELAARTGLDLRTVRRALQLGRALSG